MTNELRQALERLRSLKRYGYPGANVISRSGANDERSDEERVCRAALAEHPSDDDDPLTLVLLQKLGWGALIHEPPRPSLALISPRDVDGKFVDLTWRDGVLTAVKNINLDADTLEEMTFRCVTVRDMRRLYAVFGIPLRFGPSIEGPTAVCEPATMG